MPVIHRLSRDDTARFALIAAALARVQTILKLYDDAAAIYLSLPTMQRIAIDASVDTSAHNMAFGLARTQPQTRTDERLAVLQDVAALEGLLAGEDATTAHFDIVDLDLIIDFILAIDMMEPRSKRELERFFDALDANDVGSLTATSMPHHSGRRQKVEMVFTAKPLPIITATKSHT